jgi:DNA-binding CsgD family transcriptional regulator
MKDSAAQSPTNGTSSSSPAAETAQAVPSRPLTAKQQQAYDLRMAGKTREEGARIMGISKPVYSKTLQAAYKKLGISHRKNGDVNSNAIEIKDPERAAAVIDAATEPDAKLESISKVFRDYGLPQAVSAALLRRIRQKYYGVVEATRSLKSGEIVDALNHKIDLALRYMDDNTMAQASFRDLGPRHHGDDREAPAAPRRAHSHHFRPRAQEAPRIGPLAARRDAAQEPDRRGPGYGEDR